MEKFASLPKWGQYLATFIVAGPRQLGHIAGMT